MVSICKKAMMAKVGNRTLTDDVLATTMCLVERADIEIETFD